MKLGTDGVSKAQFHYLEMIKSGLPGQEVIRVLMELIEDKDITTEKEPVHPDWLKIYESKINLLRRSAPKMIVEKIINFFTELQPFDLAIRHIDPEKVRLTFLLGAGASKPEPSNIPTVKELLPHLLDRARRLDREDVTKLAEFCEKREIDNIEDLLTAAQLATFCTRNSRVLFLLNYLLYRSDQEEIETYPWDYPHRRTQRATTTATPIADVSSVAFLQDTLQVLFGLLASTMLPARPNKAHQAIADYANKHPNSAIVTTNYDCCMDLALGDIDQPLRYGVEFLNHDEKETDATRMIKLHGSLNWYYCETCQEVQLVDMRVLLQQYIEDKSPYPVIGICKDCGGQRRGLLVPPLAMKFDMAPPLNPLLGKARDSFEKANLIVVVGFSFAEADLYISRMLSKSMQTENKQKLLIVDPDNTIISRVRRKFKASIPNFDENRIVRLIGDCSEVLPKFLSGDFKQNIDKEKTEGKTTKNPEKKTE